VEENVDNISTFSSLDNLIESQILDDDIAYDVLLTEVVEHMSLEEAEQLIKDILQKIKFNNFVVSTPNKHFNIHYGIAKRHDDHKWEMTKEEFEKWVDCVVPSEKFIKQFGGVGCMVNDQYVTSVVYITNNK